MEARSKVIDLAAFLDRVDRAGGDADFRLGALREAMRLLGSAEGDRAKQVLLSLIDRSVEPIERATTKAACGAPNLIS